ncbi:Protein CBG25793 [Caenorhabditis briggsae]|uniref:Protein CBG25793 n=1 Tax=Caenorhabditis briggsae TaxID=6238 RepID=B6IGL6_CAEBR|nr:Protein CBG25793 [Caenorhabditis briggsae]CAR99046.1 Protein CBG25793 [Caenorhabditis briggsae]
MREYDDEVSERNYKLIRFRNSDGEMRWYWPKMKEDTEESRTIKDVFIPIMLKKMRAEGPTVDQKVLKKKNAKSKKKNVMVLVDCESFMFKLKNPKSQKGLVTQQLQVLKKGEVMEVGLEFRNPDEDKKHLPGSYHFENAQGRIIIFHADIDSFILVRRSCDYELYDREKAPPHYLMKFYGFEHVSNLALLTVKEDTEQSKKIKDVFCPIMLNKRRKAASVNQRFSKREMQRARRRSAVLLFRTLQNKAFFIDLLFQQFNQSLLFISSSSEQHSQHRSTLAMSTSSEPKEFYLEITPNNFEEITPENMKFRVKNVKDEIVMVLVDCESFMFRIKDPKFRDVLITQKFEYLKKGDEIEVELEFRNPDEDKKHLPGMYSPENAEGKMTISHAQTNRTIIVKNDTHCYDDKIYDPKEASPSDLIKFYEHQEVSRQFSLKMKEDTEESRKIKAIFIPIMLENMRAKGPTVDQKVLEKKNAKSKKKKCCTIL